MIDKACILTIEGAPQTVIIPHWLEPLERDKARVVVYCQPQKDISPICDQINVILYRSKSYDTCLSYIPAWLKNVIRGRVHVTVRRTGFRNENDLQHG